ncbi:MAG: DUF6677 family protein [Terriglobales bacterium]
MSPSATKSRTQAAPRQIGNGWWVMLLGWLFPGLGYFLGRRWVRGGLVLVCVAGMFGVGLALQGRMYGFNTRNLLDVLGWAGDLCNGVLYFITRSVGAGAGNPYTVMGDYGSTFLIAGGLLNLLAAADARDVTVGRKK